MPPRCCRLSLEPARRANSMTPSRPSQCMVGRPGPRRNGRLAMAAPCRIRPAQPADVVAVTAIERAVFSDPWSANDFRECLAAETPFLVAGRGPDVAGYAVAHFAADEGEILNLGGATVHRRGGVGRALVEQLLEQLRGRGVRVADLHV